MSLVGIFPWDTTRALGLALLKTFCLPSISGLLHQTGEFEHRPRKRYDDTALMVAELVRLGPDSPEGRQVVQRLNAIHAHFAIGQQDFVYVLSGFVAEPIHWINRYGWRPLRQEEKESLFFFWDHVGLLMNIEARPSSLQRMLDFNDEASREIFSTASSNEQVANATVNMLLEAWPRPLHAVVRSSVRSLLDPETLKSLNWLPASPWQIQAIRVSLRLRGWLLSGFRRFWVPKRRRFFQSAPPRPTELTFNCNKWALYLFFHVSTRSFEWPCPKASSIVLSPFSLVTVAFRGLFGSLQCSVELGCCDCSRRRQYDRQPGW